MMKMSAEGTVNRSLHNRGMTLVELMIVVAIVGILASLGAVGYKRYITSAKVGKLKQIAMEVTRGQESFRSRHNRYYPHDKALEKFDRTNATVSKRWSNLLEFKPNSIGADIDIHVCAGVKNQAVAGAPCDKAQPDTTKNWFVVVVEQDLNPADTTKKTTIIHTNTLPEPQVLNEGE